MPIVRIADYMTPYLVYDAPVNEATKKIRKQFDVDEETGYARHYNWRTLAKLGPEHEPEDVFIKLGDNSPERGYSTKIVAGICLALGCVGMHWLYARYRSRPFWVSLYQPVLYFGACAYGLNYVNEIMLKKAGIKNQIYIDYMRKHPERFGKVQRQKHREVLCEFIPVR